jgi:uracil-DNA glycosylase
MDNSWSLFLEEELKKDYMIKLRSFISDRSQSVNVYPARNLLFRPMDLCRYQMLKVVIIGGDPYCSNYADGLAFSSNGPTRPSALESIFDEIQNDYYRDDYFVTRSKVNPFQLNRLDQWAEQGVLLLNSVLTIEQDNVSHKGQGWEIFMENLITWLSKDHPHHLCFMVWGKQAQQYIKFIDKDKHLILMSEHPGSAKHNQNNWSGNRHFTQANNFIKKHYYGQKAEINWSTWEKR